MADVFSPLKRKEIMSKVSGKNTGPEKLVRSWLHENGFRFRLHRKDLPGKPDIVLPKYKTVIFVHGCFWHRHSGCKRATTPSTNTEYWEEKFRKNVERDEKNRAELEALGWQAMVVWECEIMNAETREKTLNRIFSELRTC